MHHPNPIMPAPSDRATTLPLRPTKPNNVHPANLPLDADDLSRRLAVHLAKQKARAAAKKAAAAASKDSALSAAPAKTSSSAASAPSKKSSTKKSTAAADTAPSTTHRYHHVPSAAAAAFERTTGNGNGNGNEGGAARPGAVHKLSYAALRQYTASPTSTNSHSTSITNTNTNTTSKSKKTKSKKHNATATSSSLYPPHNDTDIKATTAAAHDRERLRSRNPFQWTGAEMQAARDDEERGVYRGVRRGFSGPVPADEDGVLGEYPHIIRDDEQQLRREKTSNNKKNNAAKRTNRKDFEGRNEWAQNEDCDERGYALERRESAGWAGLSLGMGMGRWIVGSSGKESEPDSMATTPEEEQCHKRGGFLARFRRVGGGVGGGGGGGGVEG